MCKAFENLQNRAKKAEAVAKEQIVEIDRLREMLKEHGYSDEDINAALRRTTIAESQGQKNRCLF